ncbi:MAG: M64 family metallopeptidase, partial [Planctomycetota bacterium]
MNPSSIPLLLLATLIHQAGPAQDPNRGGVRSAGTLLLFLEGDAGGIRATRAFHKARPFHAKRSAEKPVAWAELLGPRGAIIARYPLDLRPFNMSLGAARGRMLVTGDRVLDPRVVTLVEIPDLGERLATLRIVAREKDRSRLLGTLSGARLRALLRSNPGPLAPTVKTHMNNGAVKNRYDIVILGDGYQASEIATFYRDVDRWILNLFGREPYKSYKLYFNVHSVFSPSRQSGADHPDRTPPIVKDTVYDASYNTGGTGRCLYIKNTRQALLDAALAPDVEGRIVVFVNDLRYGGCAGKFSVSYNGTQAVEVQSHEFGHSFGSLADEYSYGKSGTYTGPEPAAANITADKTGKTKWPLWMGWFGISVYEGAGHYLKGLYRPKLTCLMRALNRPLCEVCIEQLLKRCYVATSAIDNPSPPGNTITMSKSASTTVSFTDLVPGGGKITWFVDNQVKQLGQTSFLLQGSALRAGPHELRVEARDLTNKVRKGLLSLVSKRSWTVQVNDKSLPELQVLSITAPGQSRSGSSITIDTVIQNSGASATAAFQLEHFLSRNAKPTTSDVYLGSSTIQSLGLGQKAAI